VLDVGDATAGAGRAATDAAQVELRGPIASVMTTDECRRPARSADRGAPLLTRQIARHAAGVVANLETSSLEWLD
jgi:hypothetical protein